MTRDAIDEAASLLRERAGLKAEPAGRVRLLRLLAEGATHAGVPVDSYVEMVDAEPEAFRDLLDRVTVQHSDFFRDPVQFAALAEIARSVSGAAGTVWSAGCGNGQEPYSLAMMLDEVGHSDWHVVATDVSFHALTRTLLGRYTENEVRGLSPDRRTKYMVETEGGFEVAPALRRRVRVAHHNLAQTEPPPVPSCSFIFCRNVLMYFGREESEACISRLASLITPGGYLFLGHSDSPGRLAPLFAPVMVSGAIVYQHQAPRPPAATVGRRATDARRPHNLPGLLAQGQTAAGGGDLRAAIHAFRQATYLDPEMTVAFFQLGAALELAGDRREARRAFAAAGLALMRSEASADLAPLEGYTGRDLARAIAIKLTAPEVM